MLALALGMGDDEIVIHENGKIICKVCMIRGHSNQVRLGFTAPAHIDIDRKAVFERIMSTVQKHGKQR